MAVGHGDGKKKLIPSASRHTADQTRLAGHWAGLIEGQVLC